MTDEKAMALIRWMTHPSEAMPMPPKDVTLQQAYDHIAARLAQQNVTPNE